MCVCGSCSHVHGTETEMEMLRAVHKLHLIPRVCCQHKRNLNYCLLKARAQGACTSRERQNSHSAITYLCILRRLFGAPIESAVCRPVVIVLIVPHTRARTKASRPPRTHISAKFGAKNLLRLNALNSRDALSIQRAALLAMNEKVNEYISLCLATLLNILQFCYTKQSNLCRCAI